MARLAKDNNSEYILYINTHTTDKGPMGSTETKYFPVHIDYNTMIKIKELKT